MQNRRVQRILAGDGYVEGEDMRLSDKHKRVVEEMEASGYVWLSHLSTNAVMRFRYKTAQGFKGFIKVEGLTFLTKRVAEAIEYGSKGKNEKRMTYKEQVKMLEKQLVETERELYTAKGVGPIKIKRRFKDEW